MGILVKNNKIKVVDYKILTLKRFYTKEHTVPTPNPTNSAADSTINKVDQEALEMLIDLWDDGLPSHTPFEDYSAPKVVHTGLRPKSSFFPASCKGPYIETYYQATYRDLLDLSHTKHVFRSNLSAGERTALDIKKESRCIQSR